VIAHKMFERADMLRHCLRSGRTVPLAASFEDSFMGQDDMLSVSKRISNPVVLAMRQKTYGSPECFQHLIPARSGDKTVKSTVLLNKRRLVFATIAHSINGFRQLGKILFTTLLCRLSRKGRLNYLPSFQYRQERDAIESQEDRKVFRKHIKARPSNDQTATGAGALLKDSLSFEDAHTFTQRWPTHVELCKKFRFGCERLAGLQVGFSDPGQ